MSANINTEVISKAFDTVNTLGKIAANVTAPGKSQPNNNQPKPEKSNTNQPHTQTVEVKVGNPDQKEKPVVVHEKKETHVHHTYPDQRALTKDECEVEKMRIAAAQENAREERAYNLELEERARRERRERLEHERREEERRREERRKSSNRCRILGYSLLGAGLVGLGYCIYTDYRNSRVSGLPVQQPKIQVKVERQKIKSDQPIAVEGTVK